MKEYLTAFLNEYPYEGEDRAAFLSAYDKIAENEGARAKFFALIDGYERGETVGLEHLSAIEETANCAGVHLCTAEMLAVMCLSRGMEKRMLALGVEKSVIRGTFCDFLFKTWECKYICGIPGTVHWDWYCRFFAIKIFALGRLQFEIAEFDADSYETEGVRIRRGDRAVKIHIPRNGEPFDPLSCEQSIARARAFFAEKFGFGKVPFVCASWLLYPLNKRLLSSESNIVRFMDRFDILYAAEYPDDSSPVYAFLYGVGGGVAPNDLPKRTSLQRAYADHLEKGGHTGYGYGVFL